MTDSIHDAKYAKTWIEHSESGDDEFRVKHLHPYLKEKLAALDDVTLLDVGCGWGQALQYLGSNVRYYGIDIIPEFFDYIKTKYADKSDTINLSIGACPDNISFPSNHFDFILCSMVLLSVPDMACSIKTIFSKAKDHAKIIIVTFNDSSREYVESCFKNIDNKTPNSISGDFVLPSKKTIKSEVFFHKEQDYENEISKYGTHVKKMIGPIFVAYECTKS